MYGSHISVDSLSVPTHPAVNIKASKIDSFCHGVMIYLGRTHNQICQVAATLNYLVTRGILKVPLFIFGGGRHLTRDCFVSAVCKVLQATSKYAGDSFHIGVATTAREHSIQDSLIRTMG